jgi:hypothetical protein
MGTPANPAGPPLDDAADAAALETRARALAEALVAALPGWVERSVADRFRAWSGVEPPPAVVTAAREAGAAAVREVEPPLRALLAQDVDEQRANPLAIVRRAVVHPTHVLRAAGVPPVVRDAHAARLFPADDYDLSPAAFADLHASVHEPGLEWGAAKAHVVLRRRRRSTGR